MSTELSEEEKKALAEKEAAERAKAEEGKAIEITDELFEQEFERRMGAKKDQFVKKADLEPSQEEKEAAERKRKNDAYAYALSTNYITSEELEAYNTLLASDKIGVARKKFIDLFPEDKDAGATFDKMLRMDEPDEIEEGEITKPNQHKKKIADFAMKIAEQELESKGAKIKSIPDKYQQHVQATTIINNNKVVIEKAISEIPTKFELEVENQGTETTKVGITFTPEEIAEAQDEILNSTLAGKKDLDGTIVKQNAAEFLIRKAVKRLVKEGYAMGYAKGKDEMDRGQKGIIKTDEKIITSNPIREFLKEKDVPVG